MTPTAASPIPCPVPLLRARDIGHTDRALARGEIVRVVRGIYTPTPTWRPLAPWERYSARVHATALRYPDAVFCLEAACILLGLPVFGEPPYVDIVADTTATARIIDGTRIHTATMPRQAISLAGILVTSPADLVVDMARSRHPAIGLAVADAVLRTDRALTREGLSALNEQRQGSRGRRRARWVITRATPVPESPLESVSRASIEWLGFAPPELQVTFPGPNAGADRADFWWPEHRVAGEADGDLKYDGRFGDPVALLRERRVRDARLADRGVLATAHWSWHDALAADPLRAALRAAGLQPIHPAEPALLHSLARLSPSSARLH